MAINAVNGDDTVLSSAVILPTTKHTLLASNVLYMLMLHYNINPLQWLKSLKQRQLPAFRMKIKTERLISLPLFNLFVLCC